MKYFLSADEIVLRLTTPSYEEKRQIARGASIRQLMDALRRSSTPQTRQILCDILGERQAKRARTLLIEVSNDTTHRDAQCAAVDALAKIGDPQAGPPLLNLLARSMDIPELASMIVVALGAVRYAPAVGTLIALLDHEWEGIRGGAVWSLGYLRASEARAALTAMQRTEASPYVQVRLREALHK